MGHEFVWPGPPADPLELLLSGLGPALRDRHLAMLRVVDLPRALAERGYPDHLEETVELVVEDDVLRANSGAFRLEISGGRGLVTALDTPSRGRGARLHIGTLAAIYAGWLRPDRAARLGWLADASPGDLVTLQVAFDGPTPWMLDFF